MKLLYLEFYCPETDPDKSKTLAELIPQGFRRLSAPLGLEPWTY